MDYIIRGRFFFFQMNEAEASLGYICELIYLFAVRVFNHFLGRNIIQIARKSGQYFDLKND